jgi:hypothetical protein
MVAIGLLLTEIEKISQEIDVFVHGSQNDFEEIKQIAQEIRIYAIACGKRTTVKTPNVSMLKNYLFEIEDHTNRMILTAKDVIKLKREFITKTNKYWTKVKFVFSEPIAQSKEDIIKQTQVINTLTHKIIQLKVGMDEFYKIEMSDDKKRMNLFLNLDMMEGDFFLKVSEGPGFFYFNVDGKKRIVKHFKTIVVRNKVSPEFIAPMADFYTAGVLLKMYRDRSFSEKDLAYQYITKRHRTKRQAIAYLLTKFFFPKRAFDILPVFSHFITSLTTSDMLVDIEKDINTVKMVERMLLKSTELNIAKIENIVAEKKLSDGLYYEDSNQTQQIKDIMAFNYSLLLTVRAHKDRLEKKQKEIETTRLKSPKNINYLIEKSRVKGFLAQLKKIKKDKDNPKLSFELFMKNINELDELFTNKNWRFFHAIETYGSALDATRDDSIVIESLKTYLDIIQKIDIEDRGEPFDTRKVMVDLAEALIEEVQKQPRDKKTPIYHAKKAIEEKYGLKI